MAIFEFKMVHPDNPDHWREGTVEAETKEEAKATLEAHEQKKVDHRLTTDDFTDLAKKVIGPEASDNQLKKLSDRMINQGMKMEEYDYLPVEVRGLIQIHHQSKPYKFVYGPRPRKEG